MRTAGLLMLAWLLTAGQARAADAPVMIGLVGPMTGRFAADGELMRAAVELAIADYNSVGGVLGRSLVLTVDDDGCTRDGAVEAAKRLVAAGVRFVVGHFCAGASLAASAVYAASGIVQIIPASVGVLTFDRRARPLKFRLAGRDDGQGRVAGRYLAAHHAGRRIAILHDRTVYGRGLADDVREQLQKAGVPVALFEFIVAGEKDYGAMVDRLKAIDAEIVYFGGFPTEAALLLRQVRAAGLRDAVLFGGDAIAAAEFWNLAGSVGKGTLLTLAPDRTRQQSAAEIIQRLEDRSRRPTAQALQAYAAVQTWAQAAASAGHLETGAIAAEIAKGVFRTVVGDISFDADGNATLPAFTIHAWHDGRVEQQN